MLFSWIYYIISLGTAVGVALIAYNQYRVARDKLRLDLFDKRLVVYHCAYDFLKRIRGSASVDLKDLDDFKIATRDCRFLFEKEVSDFIDQIDGAARDLEHYAAELSHDNPGGEQIIYVRKRREAFERLENLFIKINKVFYPSLGFPLWTHQRKGCGKVVISKFKNLIGTKN